MAELIYGTGLRIGECVRLRVKDVNFDNNQITVRAGKGYKDRVTLLPATIVPSLRTHITQVAELHKTDLLKGNGLAPMPNALYKKYPSASSTRPGSMSSLPAWSDTGVILISRSAGIVPLRPYVSPSSGL